MKKVICITICIIMTMLLVGCGSSKQSKESSTTNKRIDYTYIYKRILNQYKRSCETNEESDFDNKQELSTGLMEMAGEKDLLHKLGYKLIDLNGDGVDELIISLLKKKGFDDYIISLYQYVDGEGVKKIEDGWARNRYYLLKDNVLLNEASGGAFNSETSKLKMVGRNLKTIAMATLDYESSKNEDEVGKLFYLYNPKGKTTKKKEFYITKKEWENIIKEWENERERVDYIPFADYK
ncbi:MAG: hypothetical protein IJ889_04865 [Eubacterium sp.]|nr:hypothetical protein [Eubacterium sp.]